MEAKISNADEITVVTLTGYMNFETSPHFRQTCFGNLLNKRVIFDLRGLNFVGSSGLTGFVEVLREFKNQNTLPVKFCGVSSEFRRLFWASEMGDIEVYEDQHIAHASFFQAVAPIQINYAADVELEIQEEQQIEPQNDPI